METHTFNRKAKTFIHEFATPISVVILGSVIALAIYTAPWRRAPVATNVAINSPAETQQQLQTAVLPAEGVALPITWGDLGAKMVEVGVIDPAKVEALYQGRGGFPPEFKKMLESNANGKVVITNKNSGYLLNLLWALGLANKNPILTDVSTAEMMNPSYGGAGNFASTGGWTLAKGSAMSHYGMHALMTLTADQQAIVDRVSRNIYRPCCGNSTHFPDCNHGMAMLGLLELMASQGVGEQEMYKTALAVNSYWFPETYLTIATYMQQKGTAWDKVSPQEMLSRNYSSQSGYANISSQVINLPEVQNAGGCSA